MRKQKLFLIDAHTLCYRSFYAVQGLVNSKGQPTNAVFGFVNILNKILKAHKPDYVAVCFDSGKKTHRQEKYAAYKIQRPKMPQELIDQMAIIKDIVRAYNLNIFELGGFEADDILATLSKQGVARDLDVVIVSEDKDMFQLVSEKVKVFNPRKEELFGECEVVEKLGFAPEYVVDFIALAGDQSDNIPGVIGIGKVTAKKLINQYGSLENIYENIDDILPEKVKAKLTGQKEQAFLSKELAQLILDVPFEIDLAQLKAEEPDKNRLAGLFRELEFKRFLKDLDVEENSEIPQTFFKKETVESKEKLQGLINKANDKKVFSFLLDKSLVFAYVCIPEEGLYEVNKSLIDDLKPLFAHKEILKITHNIKELVKVLPDWGEACSFDVMLAGYLLNPSQSDYSVKALAWQFLKKDFPEDMPAAEQVEIIYELYKFMDQDLKNRSLTDLFEAIEMPLAFVLAKMESAGVCVDLSLLESLSRDCGERISSIEKKLFDMAGEEFNLNSPKQLSRILFEKLQLPVIKKTKTGFSTDEGVLTKLSKKHEFPSMILEYRQIAKLKSTYIDALPKLVDEKTDRIHAQFNQTGTETGRLSSSHPNLQNIPIRTELGREIRKAIVPSKKHLLLSADYSQIELRILAHLSQDENMLKAFRERQDIHNFTASLIFDVKEEEVTREMRDTAKRVNFGIVYGMSSFGLSKDLGISPFEAQDFIDRYFLRYPKVKNFMDQEIASCEEKGYVTTLLGRRRYIREITSKNVSVRQFAQRQAINTPVQGTAADLMKLAMIKTQQELEKRNMQSRMLITVHDELVFDLEPKEKEDIVALVRETMEGALALSVPIKVSVKIGANWLETDEVAE